jgi:hypothetical protein
MVRKGGEAGGTVVVVSKDEENPSGYVVYTVVTTVPPDIERERRETESTLSTDCELADATEAWETDDSESQEEYPASCKSLNGGISRGRRS